MKMTLNPGVFAAVHGEDLVLLVVHANQYLLAPAAGPAVALRDNGRTLVLSDPALGAQLAEAGLASRAPAARAELSPPLITPATRHIVTPAGFAPTANERVAMLATSLAMIWRYWLAPFPRIVKPSTQPAAPAPWDGPDARLTRAAEAHGCLLPWVVWQGECLYRAAALRDYLARQGLTAAWVFGVRTWPLAAHCWLQAGDTVLNDRLERTARYTPIMVV